jgi:hypothetical protein
MPTAELTRVAWTTEPHVAHPPACPNQFIKTAFKFYKPSSIFLSESGRKMSKQAKRVSA